MSKFIDKYFKTIMCVMVFLFTLVNGGQRYLLTQYRENQVLSDQLISLQEAKIARLECQLVGVNKN